jgi:hypothetical protein
MGFSASDAKLRLNKTSILAGNALRYTIIILSVVTALASCATSPYDTPEIRRVGSAGSALGKCLERTTKSYLVSNKDPQKVASMVDNSCMAERKAMSDAKLAAGLPVDYFDYGKGRHEVSLWWVRYLQ